ncbi:glycosyl transferase [Lysobacter helvus]|uniref:Glycosyl transferase n=2 Tax=Lysobacteraceae TaxID=32033 RepID=A0ABN6FSH5_9GAMM|nr:MULTISPECIES: glycosyltransferase [Lysobacter]BCT92645.1 glycosyl transferase [Lysobacter caseinilyticus]BCT95798.1 glycosyl transferase [Lysobacter helvus]
MTRPLTIVQVLPALESGGVERSTLEIADALVRAGHRALVVSAGGRLVPRLEALGAEHITLDIGRKSLFTLQHVPPLRRLFERRGADIVHARSRMPAWIAWRALQGMRAARPRFVTTMHGLNSPSPYSAIMARGERVICVSETVRAYLLAHYPKTDPARLRVIPRGIDPQAFPRMPAPDREARARAAALHPALGGEGPLLLLPGRGTRLKGHVDALDLLHALRRDGVDARLWLPGSREHGRDRYLSELQAHATVLGIDAAVAFAPPTDAIADAYAASDLVLQVSRKPEAFGRTVLEALSVGRPVVGWDHGGVGELLRAWQPAGAVPPFDGDALVRAARETLAHPPTPPVTMPHTLRAMQDQTLAVYAELVDHR